MPYSRSGRLRAIQLPCCCAVPHRTAAAFCSVGGVLVYLSWALSLWRMNSGLNVLAASSNSSVNQITVSGMRTFTAGSLYFTLTLVGVYLVALAACCFPNRDALKHASRVIWVVWCAAWLVGLLGIVAFATGDSIYDVSCVSSSGGHSSTDCASWWQTLQIAIILSIIATLVFHFYSAVVVSAYCHTLHPHLFFQDTEDEEDDLFYSDSDSDSPLPYARSSSTRAVARYDFDPPYDNSNGMRRRASRSRTSTTAPPSYRSRERVYEAPLSDSEESSVADEGSDESFIKYEEDEDPEAARDGEVRQLRAERRREALEDMWRRREEEEAERARRPRGRQPEELFESEEDEGSEGDSESSGDERVEAWRGRERRLDAGRRENQNLLR